MKALVAVAHPDDEIVFLGGVVLALRESGHDVDVVCCTGEFGTDALTRARRREFRDAANHLGTRALMLDLADGAASLPVGTLTEILRERVQRVGYDEIYTHGVWGEYGHRHHVDVCTAVHRCSDRVWSLAGPLPAERTVAVDAERKRDLMRTFYPSQAFAVAWCTSEERLARLDAATVERLRGWVDERPLQASEAKIVAQAAERVPEITRIQPTAWTRAYARWAEHVRALARSEDGFDEELGMCGTHPAHLLGASGDEGAQLIVSRVDGQGPVGER
jgi:LmbE family N-acetylglucosaminyl deacetylase